MLLSKSMINLSINITKPSKYEFRPQLHYAMIENGIMWVTDGHRMIKCPLGLKECNIDTSERLYIHHRHLKEILKRKPKFGNVYEITTEDFSSDEVSYPNIDQLITDQEGFKSAGDNAFRNSFFDLDSDAPKFKYTELAKHENGCLQSAYHERNNSTYANILSNTEDIALTLKETITFSSDYLACMSAFPFDEAKFDGKSRLRLRNYDGHEALIMAIENRGGSLRHPSFKWI